MNDEKVSPYIDEEKVTARAGSVVPENVLKHGQDADEAMRAFEGHEGESLVLDEATNKRLLRIIDWHIMPVCRFSLVGCTVD